MTTERIEARLDPEHRSKLDELAKSDRESISEVIRTMIDKAHDERLRESRRAAARRLISHQIEDVPDPDELSRQLAAKYEFERLP